jgi:hypothetical protein
MPRATLPDEIASRRHAYFMVSDFFAMVFLPRGAIADFFLDVPATFFAWEVTALAAAFTVLPTVGPFIMEGVFFLAALLVPPLEVAINESFLTEAPAARK